ncbi:unnamed protein product, partial [Polarella glacialis]
MGDLQAVELGQLGHLTIAVRASAVNNRAVLCRERPFPRSAYFAGVCIDDFCAFEKEEGVIVDGVVVPAACAPTAAFAPVAIKQIKDEYNNKLQYHEGKEVFRSFSCTAWGSHTDGITGIHMTPIERVIALTAITLSVVDLGIASVALLDSIAGSWVAVIMHNRRFLCLIYLLYDAVKQGRAPNTVLSLSRRLKQEMIVLCSLAPFIFCDLRASVSRDVHVVDASSKKFACCSAPIYIKLLAKNSYAIVKKGRWSRLLSPTQAWLREKGLLEAHAEMPDGETFDRSLLFEGLVSSVQFTVDKIKPVIRGEHINLSEVRSWGLVEAHCSVHEQRSKPLIGTDSQVGLACVIKGRSASTKLNNLLSCMLPNVVGARLAPKGFWLPSRINPSDGPTRDVPIRLPITPLPAWYCALSFGEPDFSFIDIIVSQYVPSDMPDLDDLLKAAEPETARVLKASGFRAPPLKRFSTASPPVLACLSDNKCENLQQHNTRTAEINVCVVAASSCPSCVDESKLEFSCPTTVIDEGKCSAAAGVCSSGRRDRRRPSALG